MLVRAGLLSAVLVLSVLAFQPSPAAAVTCPPANGHVWFLGVVYDAEDPNNPREDFILDVDNFEFFLTTLRTVYCIPDTQAKILAFQNNFQRNGKTYTEANEGNVKSQIAAFGSAANAFPDSMFFFFLSSHGFVYVTQTAGCVGGIRSPGSHSVLKASAGQDGLFRDCELGAALNSAFAPTTKMVVAVDCSVCGGFSDSLTSASGTVPDNSNPGRSGVVAANRIVITGCSMTSECFGSAGGGDSYMHLKTTINRGMVYCDGYTAPGFPTFQGADAPVKSPLLNAPNGQCTASEWFFGAVASAYQLDVTGIQQQFRIKYGFPTLADDIRIF